MDEIASSRATPSAVAVSQALAAVFATPEFARAPVMRHLLTFLVNETLAGRGDRLKAYSVAVDALGRSPDFDAQTDSYPRVQVGRLRKMLASYYAGAPDVPLRMDIPLGGYRVAFDAADASDRAAPPAAPGASAPRRGRGWWIAAGAAVIAVGAVGGFGLSLLWREAPPVAASDAVVPPPTIVIEAGDTTSTARGRLRLAEVTRLLATPLSRSWFTTVVTGTAGVDSRYALRVDLDAAERTASFRLTDRSNGILLWSDTAELPEADGGIAAALRPQISMLVRPTGVIAAHQRQEVGESFAPGAPCLLQYDRYFRLRDPALARPTRRCVARTIRQAPNAVPALAAASFLVLDPGSGGGPGNLARAGAFANQASVVAPLSAGALAAEVRVAAIGGNCVRARRAAARTVRLDDSNPEIAALLGLLLVDCDAAQAHALLAQASELDPDLTTFFVPALVLMDIEAGDRTVAAERARAMRPPAPGMRAQYHIGQTLGAIAAGNASAKQRNWARVLAFTRPPASTIDEVLAHYYYSPGFRERLGTLLAESGIDPPGARRLASRVPVERAMKINVEVECTPEEARRAMGLPDFTPVHEKYVSSLVATFDNGVAPEFLDALVKSWAPMSEAGFAAWRKAFEIAETKR